MRKVFFLWLSVFIVSFVNISCDTGDGLALVLYHTTYTCEGNEKTKRLQRCNGQIDIYV